MMRVLLNTMGWLVAVGAVLVFSGCGEVESPGVESEKMALIDTYPPLDGSGSDIPTNLEAVIAVFSHRVKDGSVTTGTFFVRDDSQTDVPDVTVEASTLDDMGATYLLKPSAPGDWLDSGRTYTVHILGTIVGVTEGGEDTDPIGSEQTATFQVQ